jgi:cyclo(L-tyrosyl-L-tyrosyl) synthase
MAERFVVHPCSEAGHAAVKRAEHALIGLSPWNGYYRPSRVGELITWACATFDRVDVLLPGFEAAHTLTAAGIEVHDAVHRACRAVKRLRNPARRALERAGIVNPELHLHTWTQLANRPAYSQARARAEQAYLLDPAVRRACRLTARGAVLHAAGTGAAEPTEAQIDEAVGYAIAELPAVVNSPSIFGTETSVFVYHSRMDLVEPLISGESTHLKLAEGQGHAMVTAVSDEREEAV